MNTIYIRPLDVMELHYTTIYTTITLSNLLYLSLPLRTNQMQQGSSLPTQANGQPKILLVTSLQVRKSPAVADQNLP